MGSGVDKKHGSRALVVGSGGREHALVWRLSQSPLVRKIFAVPGNPGIANEPKTELVPNNLQDPGTYIPAIVDFAVRERVDLVVVGPEAPLVAGLADALNKAGVLVLGPRKVGAILEGSKCFAKDLMARYEIPTAPYRCFDALEPAEEYIRQHPLPVMIKADGLAGGKGTTVAETAAEALAAARKWLAKGRIVVEEFLDGEEASFTCLVSGTKFTLWPTSQDHKRLLDGDRGPMTGGMGAYSPAPVMDEFMVGRTVGEIVVPLLRALDVEMIPYTGFLYIGLMITADGPKVLEFNCRLGDPEAQVLFMRLKSDLFLILSGAARGEFREPSLWDSRPAVCVVLAAAGYPDAVRTGDRIYGEVDPSDPDIKVFHAGTAIQDGCLVTAGGRVLGLTAIGKTYPATHERAYAAASMIYWDGLQCRKDIGWRALARETASRERV